MRWSRKITYDIRYDMVSIRICRPDTKCVTTPVWWITRVHFSKWFFLCWSSPYDGYHNVPCLLHWCLPLKYCTVVIVHKTLHTVFLAWNCFSAQFTANGCFSSRYIASLECLIFCLLIKRRVRCIHCPVSDFYFLSSPFVDFTQTEFVVFTLYLTTNFMNYEVLLQYY